MKEEISTIAQVTGLIATIAAFFKWGYPRLLIFIRKNTYWHSHGHDLMMDLEREFGKDVGKTIKQLLMAIHNNEQIKDMRLDALENIEGIGVYLCDEDGKCTYANSTLATMFGMEKAEMIEYGWISPIEDKAKAFKNWKYAVENKIPYRDEYRVNGELYHTEATPSIVGNEILGYYGTVKKV